MFEIQKNNPIFSKSIMYNISQCIKFSGVSIDSRNIKQNNMFIALNGLRFDGNDYANHAILNGASVVVVNKKIETSFPMIVVKNSIDFLETLGEMNRKNNNGIFIGITGSIGKTTTKEIIAKILSKNYKTYCTPNNQNNYIGLPLTLSNNPSDTEISVIEISMSNKGEIAKKSKLVMPNIAIITSTGLSHAGNFNEPIEISNTKSEIFDYLQKDGIAILCSTGELSNQVIENAKNHKKVNKIITYGYSINDDIRLLEVTNKNGSSIIKINMINKEISYKIQSISKSTAINSMAAIAIAKALNICIESILPIIESFSDLPGRGEIITKKLNDNIINIINDGYNASYESTVNTIMSLKNLANQNNGRKIFVFGEFVELGKFENIIYKRIQKYFNEIDILYTTSKFICEKMNNKIKFGTNEEIAEEILNNIKHNDNIAIKGSNASNVSKISEIILKKIDESKKR